MSPIVSVSHVISYSPIGSIMSRSVSCCLIISHDVYDCDELVLVRELGCQVGEHQHCYTHRSSHLLRQDFHNYVACVFS